jgi:hypothetical protein
MVRARPAQQVATLKADSAGIYHLAMAEDEWINPAEAARLLHLPERIVYTLIEEGKVHAVHWPVRIRRSDLHLCLEACRIKPGDLAHLNRYPSGRHHNTT